MSQLFSWVWTLVKFRLEDRIWIKKCTEFSVVITANDTTSIGR